MAADFLRVVGRIETTRGELGRGHRIQRAGTLARISPARALRYRRDRRDPPSPGHRSRGPPPDRGRIRPTPPLLDWGVFHVEHNSSGVMASLSAGAQAAQRGPSSRRRSAALGRPGSTSSARRASRRHARASTRPALAYFVDVADQLLGAQGARLLTPRVGRRPGLGALARRIACPGSRPRHDNGRAAPRRRVVLLRGSARSGPCIPRGSRSSWPLPSSWVSSLPGGAGASAGDADVGRSGGRAGCG